MNNKHYDIQDVLIYLRKSRGDEEKDLINHEIILTEMCKKFNWKYTIEKEIGSSDSIELRPVLSRILVDIEDGLYDAIAVVDEDRLSRGDLEDQGMIKRILSNSETFIVTPQKIYDLKNEEDDFIHDVNSLFARREYKMIRKRFKRGKVIGARRGNWTNGTPPFPYEYQKYKDKYNEKGLVVNDEKLVIYNFIKGRGIDGVPPEQIAFELNQQSILSPRKKAWTENTIRRLLIDETHLGKIISNKEKSRRTKSGKIQRVYNPKSEWTIVENCHEPIKTLHEHNRILGHLNERAQTPNRARAGTYTFSGLVKCGVCGNGMSFVRKEHKKENEKKEYIKACWYKDAVGNSCPNKGIKLERVMPMIIREIYRYKSKVIKQIEENPNDNNDIKNLESQIDLLEAQLKKYNEAIDKVNDAYELGDYDRDEWLKRREKWDKQISKAQEEVNLINYKIENSFVEDDKDKLVKINNVLENMDNAKTSQERNELFSFIIKEIIFTRLDEEEVDVKVDFK